MRFFLIIFVFFALSLSPAYAQEKVFNAESFELKNGMQVVVISNHRAPVVTHMVWYKVGAADEPHGKSGIAHFMEHLMFKGSTGFAPGEFSRTVKKLGGNDNAFTSQDYTAYFQTIAKEHLETVMTMEAGRMRGMNPPLEEVESERLVILEERRQRTDNNPRNHFSEQIQYMLFPNHPYGTPVLGWGHEMAALSWDDAKTFYDHWYAPNNAILIVSGDVTAKELKPLAEKIYGPLEPQDIPERIRTDIPPFPGVTDMTLSHPTIHDRQFQRIYRMPSARKNRTAALALQIFEDLMSNGSTSRLYKSIVIDQQLAASVSLSYLGSSWDDGRLWFSATLKDDVTFENIETALEAELQKIMQDGIGDEELRRSKDRMKDAAIFARDSITGPAMIFGRSLSTGSTINDIEFWPHDIEKITTTDIQNAVKAHIIENGNFIDAVMVPEETATQGQDNNTEKEVTK